MVEWAIFEAAAPPEIAYCMIAAAVKLLPLKFSPVCPVASAAVVVGLVCAAAAGAQETNFFSVHQAFLKKWCQACHLGETAAGGFRLDKVGSEATFGTDTEAWMRVATRVRNMEMPPRLAPAPPLDAREGFIDWIDHNVREEACSEGIRPGPARIRRLNRDEYAATVRDLLNVNIDVGAGLPVEGAGGEGFDNAAETLTLSPIHAEKYMEAAKIALDFAATDARAKAAIFIVRPDAERSEANAAAEILQTFVARAFRHPADKAAAEPYLQLFHAARRQGESFEQSVLFSLRGVLMSPQFLFHIEASNPVAEPRLADEYALASRLSYFLWGSMPDELLWDIAATGRLHDPEILKGQVGRMLRNPKSTEFERRFVEQWLRTRDLGRDKAPDAELFPVWAESEEVRSDLRYQPVLFFRELLTKNLSLLNLLDSKFTVLNRTLAKLYNVPVKWRQDAARALYPVELPEGSDRGGLLGMPGVLTLSSYPNRTSPVLRGAWVLDTILGTPPPPPPPGVPPLAKEHAERPETVRERLTQHRANPACASCHQRMDPIGFALENYDAMGFWRTEDAGKPIDATGELPDGRTFQGPLELKAVLLDRKDLFIRNLTSKLLGYALGRGLTLRDSCVVDSIVEQVKANGYSAQSLIEGIVFSVPFQYQGEGHYQDVGKKASK